MNPPRRSRVLSAAPCFVALLLSLLGAITWMASGLARGSSVEIGTVWFPAVDRGTAAEDFKIATVRVSPADWLPGSRIMIEVETTYQQVEITNSSGTSRYCGNGWLRLMFTGVTPEQGDVQDASAPLTYGDEEARYIPPTTEAGAGWYRVGVNAANPAMRPGIFQFSVLAPTGREHFVRPKLEMFVEYPAPNPVFAGQYFSAICNLRATPLDPPTGTTLTAAAAAVQWGSAPKVVVKAISAIGIPTGKVTVTGPGVEGTGTLAANGTSAQCSIILPATLPVGNHNLTVTYAGEGSFTGSTTSTGLVVLKCKPSVETKVVTKPTPLLPGKIRVTVESPGAGTPGRGVAVKFTKGGTKRNISGTLKKGAATLTIPPLAAGRWKVEATYEGDKNHTAAKAKTANLKVKD